MSATVGDPVGGPVGGPAQEARRLVEALGDWATARLGAADEHLATGAAECQVCPVCQLISALRGDRPELLARLGEAWTAFLGVLTDHSHPPADANGGTAPPPPTPPPAPTAQPGAGAKQPSAGAMQPSAGAMLRPVQNIHVR